MATMSMLLLGEKAAVSDTPHKCPLIAPKTDIRQFMRKQPGFLQLGRSRMKRSLLVYLRCAALAFPALAPNATIPFQSQTRDLLTLFDLF